ncbi:MAG: DUF6364 family protein [Bacteroidota bacterium]
MKLKAKQIGDLTEYKWIQMNQYLTRQKGESILSRTMKYKKVNKNQITISDSKDFIRIFVEIIRTMLTKLTLSIDEAVIARAKVYARKNGRSLSELIQHYLESITSEKNEAELSAKLSRLLGAVKLPKDFDEKKELRTILEKKHL